MPEVLKIDSSELTKKDISSIAARIFAGALTLYATQVEAGPIPDGTSWEKAYPLIKEDIPKDYEVGGIVATQRGRHEWKTWVSGEKEPAGIPSTPIDKIIETLNDRNTSEACAVHTHEENPRFGVPPESIPIVSMPPSIDDALVALRNAVELPEKLQQKQKINNLGWAALDRLGNWSYRVMWNNPTQAPKNIDELKKDIFETRGPLYALVQGASIKWTMDASYLNKNNRGFRIMSDAEKRNYLVSHPAYRSLVTLYKSINISLSYRSHEEAQRGVPCEK